MGLWRCWSYGSPWRRRRGCRCHSGRHKLKIIVRRPTFNAILLHQPPTVIVFLHELYYIVLL
jgi:hypothetical protein